MTVFQIIAVLLTLTALASYANHRFIRLPTTIGVMLIALLGSLGLLAAGHLSPAVSDQAASWLSRIDFDDTLLHGMLSFLLFAGALQINLDDLAEQKGVIGVLAFGGVLLSTALFGALIHLILNFVGLPLPFVWCLLFGALISPTDPVAVLGILKSAKVPRSLETKIAGESLFNDGVGVVLFLVLSGIAVGGHAVTFQHIASLFLQEALGGVIFGLGIGYLTFRLLRSVDNYQVEVLLTLALVVGGYALATAWHLSGPIAIVVAGLLIGNHGRRLAMSSKTREHLDTFWELVDEILNAVLFVLIGLEVLLLTFSRDLLLAGILAIPTLLLARLASVGLPMQVLRRWRSFTPGAVTIMTWGGLRGGISVALALSLPPGREREIVLAITYVIVVFSILVQGLTLQPVVRRCLTARPSAPTPPTTD